MKMPVLSRILFGIVGIFLAVGAHKADYNETHIFNPHWPPHAKFHTGQTLMFSIALGLCTLFFAFRKAGNKINAVLVTTLFAGLYWVTQAGAILYPGTDFWDTPEEAVHLLGLPGQLFIDICFLLLIGFAAWFALRKSAKWG